MTARDTAHVSTQNHCWKQGGTCLIWNYISFTAVWEFNSPFQSLTLWLYGLISLFIDGTVL